MSKVSADSTELLPVTLTPMGVVRTVFRDKFAIPRQAGIARNATGYIDLPKTHRYRNALRGIEGFTHLWIIYLFHDSAPVPISGLVRPPRLGGKTKAGVFATRSPHRFNPIGISCVKLERIEINSKGIKIHISGVDILDKTPCLDIKPYLPQFDRVPRAKGGWAQEIPPKLSAVTLKRGLKISRGERSLIREILCQDPRPPYRSDSRAPELPVFSALIGDMNVKWRVKEVKGQNQFEVFEIARVGF